MAYVSGTANDLAALRTAIINACTANGWTLNGSVLSKGALYLSIAVNGNYLDIQGGTGIDGNNALTGAAPAASRIGSVGGSTQWMAALTWPVAYEVFIGAAPDEVYVVVNYSATRYQWLAWGKSTVSLPGTGMWVSGSYEGGRTTFQRGFGITCQAFDNAGDPFGYRGSYYPCPALFHANYNFSGPQGEYVNTGLGGPNGWNDDTSDVISAAKYRAPLDKILPSAWNSETVLLPIQPYSGAYGSSKVAMVADLQHARACRIDNLAPGEVITLGSDRWKAYPWYLKDTTVPAGGSSIYSTGCLGWAIRYDGP
jgi:hypothetical protein